MPVEIVSRQNAAVRNCRALARGRDGDRVLLDGVHLLEDAVETGLPIELVITTSRIAGAHQRLVAALEAVAPVYLAADDIVQSASPVRTSSGIVGVATLPAATVAETVPQHAPEGQPYVPAMAVALVDVQDPGNAGAVVRAVEAAGGTGVIACGTTADLRSWKALRASMGSAFRVPLAHASLDELAAEARLAGVRLIASTLDAAAADMRDVTWNEPFILLIGNEGRGLDPDVAGRAELAVRIPMFGKLQSMNAALSAAVILYEAERQRTPPNA